MNCHEFALLLDEHGLTLLGDDHAQDEHPKAEERRRALTAHAEICAECGAALAALAALSADPIPAVSASIDLGALGADRATVQPRDRRGARVSRAAGAAGLFLLGGVVFAGIGFLSGVFDVSPGGSSGTADQSAGVADPVTAPPAGSASLDDSLERGDVSAQSDSAPVGSGTADADAQSGSRPVLLGLGSLPDGEFFKLLAPPPAYPPAAANRGLEGQAIIEFTIDENGNTKDAFVVSSSNPVFEQTSIDSVLQQKYKPRVVAGRAVTVKGVRNIIRYQLEPKDEQASAEAAAKPDVAALDWTAFHELLAPAYACLATNDLLCIELEIDEIRATEDLAPDQEAYLWQMYGFVYYRRGQYELAIEAYRNAAGEQDGGAPRPRYLMTLALLYFQRNQYQEALDAMTEYLKVASRPTLDDYLFVDQLRELGAQPR